MKKYKYVILILVLMFSIIPLTENTKAATKQITIKGNKKYKIQKGEKIHLYVKGHKKSKNIKWKSSNKLIASVSKKGVVTGKKGGTAKITVTIKKKKYSCKVTVMAGEKIVYKYDAAPSNKANRFDMANFIYTKINTNNKTLYAGQTFSLKVTGTKKKIKWKSSDKKVAAISSAGKISAKKPGKTTITARFERGNYIYEHTCKITVVPLWMTEKNIIKNYSVAFSHFENTIQIIGAPVKESLSGMAETAFITNVPKIMKVNTIYGTTIKYKYNGTDILYNLKDLRKLKLLE